MSASAVRAGLILLAIVAFSGLTGCQLAPPVRAGLPIETLADGVYEASYHAGPNAATVEVTLGDGRITAVKVVRHFSSWKGRAPEEIIPERIVAAQSADVDVVSGATNSSRVIMHAVRRALDKALMESR